MITVPFNKPYLAGSELAYIENAIRSGKISGNGAYTKKCQSFFEKSYGFGRCFLTTSCTDALEMAAILLEIVPGDEVIMPAYTFVSSANAFVLRGAKIVFVDSRKDHPGMDEQKVEELITSKTRAIVTVHYAGVACDMDVIMSIANRYNLIVIEDAAQAIESYYIGKDGRKKALGSIGHMAAFSFHETKNIISGEGGMLVVNATEFQSRAEIIWEKGTNRSAFFRGEVDKYNWVDVGSSFLPSEIIAAFLWAQLEHIERIQARRISIWQKYFYHLKSLPIRLPLLPTYATNNAHMFYLVCDNLEQRTKIIESLKSKGILAVFHYLGLNSSPYYISRYEGIRLENSENYTDCLLRLPFYYELQDETIKVITETIDETLKGI